MSQKIHLGGDNYAVVDQLWPDFGEAAKRGVMGGVVVELAPARTANPTICRRGEHFFYMDARQQPVDNPDHLTHITDPIWGPKAREFAAKAKAGLVKAAPNVVKGAAAAERLAKKSPKVAPFRVRVKGKFVKILGQKPTAAALRGGVELSEK